MTTRTIQSATPAICGAAQVIQRPGETNLTDARGPIELMVDAARAAAEDAGAVRLLEQIDWVAVVGGLWSYRNPGQLIADLIGAPDARTALTGISGTAPVDLLGVAAERISRGEIDVALIVGGEARWSHQQLKRNGVEPTWLRAPGVGQPERFSPLPDPQTAARFSPLPDPKTAARIQLVLPRRASSRIASFTSAAPVVPAHHVIGIVAEQALIAALFAGR